MFPEGVHLILIGCICQLVAGVLSFRKYDHLSGTAFMGYAALWASYGATRIYSGMLSPSDSANNMSLTYYLASNLSVTNTIPASSLEESAVSGLVPYILLSFLLALLTATGATQLPPSKLSSSMACRSS